tara:strand:- start:167 stop:1234 length:1068 start_codon:yes stop_codon:yes gene_type:complete
MNLSTNSKFLSIKYIASLLRASGSKSQKIKITDTHYSGLESEQLELKTFKAPKPLGRSIILYPGASPLAEEHPSMIFLASTLADIGFNVYIPRIPLLKKLDISEDNVKWFDHAYQQLLSMDEIKDTKVSCIGVSYGGAILLKTSLSGYMQAHKPHCLFTYGTIYDIPTSIDFLMTGKLNIKGKDVQIKPHEWGLVVGFHNFLSKVDIGYNTDNIQKVLAIRVKDEKEASFEAAERLDGDAKTLALDILNGNISKEIKRIIDIIQKEQIHLLDGISPKHWCNDIDAKVFIMHGANDNMVPYTQSTKLSKGISDSELFISYLYEHNEIAPKRSISHKLRELSRLVSFFEKFIRYHEN